MSNLPQTTVFDALLNKQIQNDGVPMPSRSAINILSGSVVDNPDNDSTDITVTGAGGSTTTLASFVQPVVDDGTGTHTVSVTPASLVGAKAGLGCQIAGGGTYLIQTVSGGTVTLLNQGASGNATPGTTIAEGAVVTFGGLSAPASAILLAGQGLVYDASGKLVPKGLHTVISVKSFGATGNGTTDDTAAIQAAIVAFEALSANPAAVQNGNGGAPGLYFPSGVYAISAPLVVKGVYGGIIFGDGPGNSILLEKGALSGAGSLVGQAAVLRLTNCAQVTVQALHAFCAQDFNEVASLGVASVVVTNGGSVPASSLAPGMRVALLQGGATFGQAAEILTVESVVGTTTVNFTSQIVESYTTGGSTVYLCVGPYQAFQCYNDATDATWANGACSENSFDRCTVARNGSLVNLIGFGTDCKGGPPVEITAPIASGAFSCAVADIGQLFVTQECPFFDSYYQESEYNSGISSYPIIASGGITMGPAVGPVAHTGSGPAGTSLTFSGTPTADDAFLITITTGGPVGTSVFKWSKNGGSFITGVVTSATPIALADGVSVAFAAGTYVLNDVYQAQSAETGHGVVTFTTALQSNHAVGAMLGSISDANNDVHTYTNCKAYGSVVGGWSINGMNSLQLRLFAPRAESYTYAGVYAPRGGSAEIHGAQFACSGYDLVVGGFGHHPWTLIGGYDESTAGLIYCDPSFNSQNLDVRIIGFNKINTPNSSLINVTVAKLVRISFVSSQLALSSSTSISIVDSSGSGNGSFFSQDIGTVSGVASLTLTGVEADDDAKYPAGAPTQTLSSGGSVVGRWRDGLSEPSGAVRGLGTSSQQSTNKVLVNNNNNDVAALATLGFTKVMIIGPTGPYAITGIAGGIPGQVLELYSTVNVRWTISNLSSSSSAGHRIQTPTGADMVFIGPGVSNTPHTYVRLVYDSAVDSGNGGWRVTATQGIPTIASPRAFAGLAAWLTAGVVTQSGGVMSAWVDRSSALFNLNAKSTTSFAGYSSSGGPNSIPELTFSGAQSIGSTSVNMGGMLDGCAIFGLLAFTGATQTSYATYCNTNDPPIFLDNGGTRAFRTPGGDITGGSVTSSYEVWTGLCKSGSQTFRVNGAQVGSGTNAQTVNPGSLFYFGADNGGNHPMTGGISELFILKRYPTMAEVLQAEDYLRNESGLW